MHHVVHDVLLCQVLRELNGTPEYPREWQAEHARLVNCFVEAVCKELRITREELQRLKLSPACTSEEVREVYTELCRFHADAERTLARAA